MPFKNSEARKKYLRDHYQSNKKSYLARNKVHMSKRREVLRAAKDVPCADCGQEYPPYVMDFDHRPGSLKRYAPNTLIAAVGMKTLLAEVAKCDVVCSNCHRIRTFTRPARKNAGIDRVE